MALRNLCIEGDDILRKKCRSVEAVDDKTRQLLDDMIDTMREYCGVGIAAPQVGIMRRIFVAEPEEGNVIEFINPEILEVRGSAVEEEGCLSVPGYVGKVDRPEYVKIKGLDRNGNPIEYEAEGLTAVIFSHECDHLDGILFTDKATDIRQAEEEQE